MSTDDIIKTAVTIATTMIASLGGGAVIITAVSKWWGDFLAERLLAGVAHKHEKEIEKLEELGCLIYGENRVQAFLDKYEKYQGKGHSRTMYTSGCKTI